MNLDHRTENNVTVVTVAGRIDQLSADSFKDALVPYLEACKKDAPAVLLDFSGVEYISSVGLRVLMLAARQTTEQGGRIGIASLQPLVNEVFEISRFNLVFKVYGSVEDAIKALA